MRTFVTNSAEYSKLLHQQSLPASNLYLSHPEGSHGYKTLLLHTYQDIDNF